MRVFWTVVEPPTILSGGQRGIRTLDTFSHIHAFQACAFNRSATCPFSVLDVAQAANSRAVYQNGCHGSRVRFCDLRDVLDVATGYRGTIAAHAQKARTSAGRTKACKSNIECLGGCRNRLEEKLNYSRGEQSTAGKLLHRRPTYYGSAARAFCFSSDCRGLSPPLHNDILRLDRATYTRC